jgi:hypothetical protein
VVCLVKSDNFCSVKFPILVAFCHRNTLPGKEDVLLRAVRYLSLLAASVIHCASLQFVIDFMQTVWTSTSIDLKDL